MDKAKMIAEIAARHNVRLDQDDPAFLLVDLNMMALEEGTENLTRWKDDLTALVGALEQGSKKWEETASSIGKAIFENQKREFIKDTDQERDAFLRTVRTELNSTLNDAMKPVIRRLDDAAAHSGGGRSFLWAAAGALVGSVIGCAATFYIVKHSFPVDEPTNAPAHSANNRR